MAEILKDIQLLCIEKHVENKKEYVVNLKWKFYHSSEIWTDISQVNELQTLVTSIAHDLESFHWHQIW